MGKQQKLKKERKETKELEKPYLSDQDRETIKDSLNQIADLAETMQTEKLNEELFKLLSWFRAHFDNICKEANTQINEITNINKYNVDTREVAPLTSANMAKTLLTLGVNTFPLVTKEPVEAAFTPNDVDEITDIDNNEKLLEIVGATVKKVAECNRAMSAAQTLCTMNDMALNLKHERFGDIRIEKGQRDYPCHEITDIRSGVILLATSTPKLPPMNLSVLRS